MSKKAKIMIGIIGSLPLIGLIRNMIIERHMRNIYNKTTNISDNEDGCCGKCQDDSDDLINHGMIQFEKYLDVKQNIDDIIEKISDDAVYYEELSTDLMGYNKEYYALLFDESKLSVPKVPDERIYHAMIRDRIVARLKFINKILRNPVIKMFLNR